MLPPGWQSLAEAGGICISGTVYDQIKNKLAFRYEYVGEQTVKNIKEPVKIYRVLMEPGVKVAEVAAEKKAEAKTMAEDGPRFRSCPDCGSRFYCDLAFILAPTSSG